MKSRRKKDSTDAGILLLRLVFGISLAFQHGWPTVRDWAKGMTDYPDPLGIGSELTMVLMGFSELVCALFKSFENPAKNW